ncbi:regulator of G-protein signaling 22 isoform X1 [Ctenopharyngodon idella]|uniref:regulator of G-protein signaling 22 isoform X1 n=1 Tax=Ctenopharyngodon idella TaxID=7959 RepID=UPI002231B5AC|nr:regulator of G-protein signaling 22 isoform X1 [Ctenopharyngodon idella]
MSRTFPDLPEITSENFEQSLSDQIFVEFFNAFLQLPVFGPAVRYDGISAGFELLDHTAEDLSRRIRTALHQIRSKPLSDLSWIPDNSYTVTCLERDQSLQWLKRDRLPFFLQSDCYFEFRLTKCLSQLSGPWRSGRPVTVDSSSSHVCDERCLRSGWSFCSFSEKMNSSFSAPKTADLRTANGRTAVGEAAHSQSAGRSCEAVARQNFLDFKRSLVGGPGENILHLWMDIERLKTLSAKTRSRFLGWMKGQYVVSSSPAALSEQLLSRLGLNSTISWQEEQLRDIQPRLSEILLLYWGQRFCLFSSDRWQISEHVLSSPVCVHSVSSVCADAELQSICACSDMKVELDGSEIQTLLEVLHTESRSGFFFTHFCQNSGQQLWENTAYFCLELLQYRQLFCQSRFDPYRVQRTAQLLYASFLSSGAPMSVCLSEERRRAVLLRLSPAFEDLFDPAEEHALNVLLEPWTLLSQTLRDALHTVALWEEVRYAEVELFQTLQTLYTHTQSRRQQERRTPPAPAPDLWSKVPREFRRFRLDSLLQNHLELQNFLSFLEENSVSLDLQCWLDVEQLKNSDAELLEERITNIRDKYLSSNFLFGAGSPATEEQQMRLLQMCGGWQRLQHESVSLSVLTELQSLLHNRLETRWLPLFLSSSEFIARQQQQQRRKVTEVCEKQPVVRQRRKRHVWKQVSAGSMSCSQESVCLRRALLNPVTRLQFQKFLSACDDLLENDLLFWLEVQRYKDLCHSRCDDITLQRKVSIIISRFISSSVPPALQIHVPPEAAQRVVSQQRALGPYVFRETQVCVFSELLKHWPEFVALRSAVGEDDLLRMLDQKPWRERQRSRRTDEQDDSSSQCVCDEEQQEEDEAHAGADEEQQQNSGNDGMKAATYKISWSYWKHMAALEHRNTAEVTSSSSSCRSSGSPAQPQLRRSRHQTRPKSENDDRHQTH